MILCDREILQALEQKRLLILPEPDGALMNSTTVDLRLDGTLDRWVFPAAKPELGQERPKFCPGTPGFKFSQLEKEYTHSVDISQAPYDLPPEAPDNFLLGWTLERIYLPYKSRLCARVEGKSSFARMGLGVHVTAPTVHAGWGHNKDNDQDHGARLRLEIWNVGPIPVQLVKGMRICQLIVEEVREVPSAGYSGQFNMQAPNPAESK
jgi:dCTP deaminase